MDNREVRARVSNPFGMSPLIVPGRLPTTRNKLDQIVAVAGSRIRAERDRRGWSLATLALRAGVSRSAAQTAESGKHASLEMIVALSAALGLSVELDLVDRKRRDRLTSLRSEDPVHAAMGELEARRLRGFGFPVAIDEPYQHYQFSGRADLAAWSVEDRALLHLENRTQFPNVQESLGSFNAKRAYLASELAARLGLRPFVSETHVMVCLWSSEVLHALRIHPETFRATCPDPADRFAAWWGGVHPAQGRSTALIVLDPLAEGRQRQWVDLETAISITRPRVRGYADAALRLRDARR